MHPIWRFLTSLRLTVVLLLLAILLVLLGTYAQVHEGLWNGQDRWFRNFIVVRTKADPWWIPPIFPGGYSIGFLLLFNLIAAHIKRFHLSWNKVGINLTHLGVIILLVGQLSTDLLSRESILNFREGETRYFSESTRKFELAFIRSVDGEKDEVVSIPQGMLDDNAVLTHEKLPFKVRVDKYWINSEPAFRAPMQQNAPPLGDKGIAADFDFKSLPEAKGMNERNLPTAIVEITGNDGKALGKWVVPSWADDPMAREGVKNAYTRSVGAEVAKSIYAKFSAPQTVDAGGNTWRMALRPERYYKDYAIKLLKTTHDIYPGTQTAGNPQGIPKNFMSRVEISNPSTGEKREVDISMNNPLRYEGLAFFQSTMGRDEIVDAGRSGLQVVRNPSWLTAYLGCIVVGFGMAWQFLYHLVRFMDRHEREAAASAA